MEGPSLVIACEEFAKYKGHLVKSATGTAKLPFAKIKGRGFKGAKSFGKHLVLQFESLNLRIHFLMFGSYRINKKRENRTPKMTLKFEGLADTLYFYSCAISVLEGKLSAIYDPSIDLMSPKWDPGKALESLGKKPKSMICDVLMDQTIFAGLGNIIKNEVLYLEKLHPEIRIQDLSARQRKGVVKRARAHSLQFYEWKKINQLKRNWQIFRKKHCPVCESKVVKKPTGTLKRISHYCPKCQAK